jgi:hypothetical protein
MVEFLAMLRRESTKKKFETRRGSSLREEPRHYERCDAMCGLNSSSLYAFPGAG